MGTVTEPNEPTGDVYESFGGGDQLDTSESLTGDNTQDALDAGGYDPPDREPKATRFGTTADEQATGETLDQLLAEEEPDITPDDSFEEEEPRAGRLVAPGGDEFGDLETDAVAEDVGFDGGAASAEEAAVHVVDEDV